MSFPDIVIGSKFDAKGFKKAESAITGLTSKVGKAAGALGLALSARAAINFGKASVKAFADDQKAAAILTNTLKNLGMAFEDANIKSFIERLSITSGVVDDQLRPAFQRLLQATKSISQSQSLLSKAIDISVGSSQPLETVVLDLANAYVGNNKGLKKYTLGLTAAELKTASFDTVMQAFNKNFSGANAAFLDTYAGKLQRLTTVAGEAKEEIGSGLVDAFKILGTDKSLDNFISKVKNLGTSVGDFFRGLAIGFRDLAKMPVIKQLIQLAEIMLKIIEKTVGAFVDPFTKAGARYRSSQLAPASDNQFLKDHTKSLVDNTSVIKANTVAVKKMTDKFNVQKAGIAAALANPNISADTRTRLLGLQAIENGNVAAANKYGGMVKSNASMASPTPTVVNVYPQGNVLTEENLITSIQNGIERNFTRTFGPGAYDK